MSTPTRIHLVDGTWELFRHHFGVPGPVRAREGAAARAVARSMASLLEDGATHVGIATDHVVESFRNALWPGYKTGDGIDPHLFAQFGLLEDILRACGFVVWPMVEFEADDALASAAAIAGADPAVDQVVICSPDKDLAQCVRGTRIVQLDRRTDTVRDEAGVIAHFGVAPAQIPAWLALVGDSADGFPGLAGWGARSAAAVLSVYGSIDEIPDDPATWSVPVRGAPRLAAQLADNRALAELFMTLARLSTGVDVLPDGVDELRWRGPGGGIDRLADRIGAPELGARLRDLAARRAV
jgi:5'-3' exonuclease